MSYYYYYYTWYCTYRICYKISLCLVLYILFEADITNVQTVDESHSDSHVYPDRTQTHIASQRDKNHQQHHFLGYCVAMLDMRRNI